MLAGNSACRCGLAVQSVRDFTACCVVSAPVTLPGHPRAVPQNRLDIVLDHGVGGPWAAAGPRALHTTELRPQKDGPEAPWTPLGRTF